MGFPKSGGFRILGAIALVALVFPLTHSLAASAGRDYSRCVHTCNDARATCNDRCAVDCEAMFPNDNTARNACVSICHNACLAESTDCKVACKEIKNPYTEEP